jgi:hypothetical protein
MSLIESFEELSHLLKTIDVNEVQKENLETIKNHILSCKMILLNNCKQKTIIKKELKCLKCNTTNPENFNRKKSECIQCMSKAGYEKIKVRLDLGKERNIQARMDRKECSVCNLKVERHNAQMFDWDHKNPAEKRYAISKMNYKEDAIFFEEITKCDLTCRNCHMMRTMLQFQQNEIPKRLANTKQ